MTLATILAAAAVSGPATQPAVSASPASAPAAPSDAAPAPTPTADAPAPTADAPAPTADAPTDETPAADGPGRIEVAADVQLGYHERTPIPAPDGLAADVSRGVSAATSLAVSGALPRHPRLDVFGVIGYRSAIGMRAALLDAGGTPRRPRGRSQDLNLDVGVSAWPARARDTVGLFAAGGYALRPFHIEAKLGFPGYALHGPQGSAGMQFHVAQGVVRLSFSGRAGLAMLTRARALREPTRLGALVGGAATMAFRLHRRLFLTLNYREQHGLFRDDNAQHDTSRWATAGLAFIHQTSAEPRP